MQAELAVINNQHLATGRSFPPPSVITLQTFEVGKGLHASCCACFDTVGCIFKHQAGRGVRGGAQSPWQRARRCLVQACHSLSCHLHAIGHDLLRAVERLGLCVADGKFAISYGCHHG